MKNYTVTWVIDVVATTPEMAAQQAAALLNNPRSRVLIFAVKNLETGHDGVYDVTSDPPRKIL